MYMTITAAKRPAHAAARPRMGLRFGEVLDEWLGSRSPELKASTVSTYRTVIEKHLRPELGDVPLRRLTDGKIQEYLETLKPLSPSTERIIENVLHQSLSYASRCGCAADPEKCRCNHRTAAAKIDVLSDAELEKIVSALGKSPAGMDLGVLISLRTGLRVGEVCALRWQDIMTDEGLLCVEHTVQRISCGDGRTDLHIGEPKSAASRRRIPLPPSLAEILEGQRGREDAFILSGRPDRPTEPRSLQRHFKMVLRRANVRDVNFHVLRHSFATRCIERGFDVKSLSLILGHASVSTTMNTYVHPSMARMRSLMSMMDD